MAYRNKTYVAFASENIRDYRMMEAWRDNEHIDFNFHDAHDLVTALDTSLPETIRRRLRERLNNTKQVVLLVGDVTRRKAADPSTFLYYEVETIAKLNLPVVFVNLNQSRGVQKDRLPQALLEPYSISVSYQPRIVQYALDNYVGAFQSNLSATSPKRGPYHYKAHVYADLGL